MQFVFFYGTLMTVFNRPERRRIDDCLVFRGVGTIAAALFDLGVYPGAVPVAYDRVRGELFEVSNPEAVFDVLDDLEGCYPDEPESSLYTRRLTAVTTGDSESVDAWVYFYSAPLRRARRIASGDYLEYLKALAADR